MGRGVKSMGSGSVARLLAVASQKPTAGRALALFAPSHGRHEANRRINGAAALLAAAALADSGIEHYRGSFHNKAMYLPLGVSALTLYESLRDASSTGAGTRPGRDIVTAAALATGLLGGLFHIYNVEKRPGGLSWLNLFYGAPLGAPLALSLAGALRHMSGMSIGSVRRGRLLAALVSAGLLGTSAEAALLHFRGAYQNPAMVLPVAVPPIAAAFLARAAIAPKPKHRIARWTLGLAAAIGLVGSAFHARGIGRNMGGWGNLSQNLLAGPPLPAPPSFTALAGAGLAALGLIESRRS